MRTAKAIIQPATQMDTALILEIEKSFILHWNYRNLETLPEELRYHGHHVEDIYLKGNHISRTPSWIIEMENLVEIYLSENRLLELPNEIFKLKSLRVLDVSQNQIRTLPPSFTLLTQLNAFSANDNQLTALPSDIGKLKSLSFLYVAMNCLKLIPHSIEGCVNLQEIKFDYNKLVTLPRCIVFLPKLRYISIRNNQLRYLPAIPFVSEPLILIENNHLTHVSLSFAKYLRRRHIPPIQNNEWHFNNKRTNDEDKVHDTGQPFLFPVRIISTFNSNVVPSLYEQAIRAAYTLCYLPPANTLAPAATAGGETNLVDSLPNVIKSELTAGPTAVCEHCRKCLFDFAFVKIFRLELPNSTAPHSNLHIVQYFCNNSCAVAVNSSSSTTFTTQDDMLPSLIEIKPFYI